jgi:hypothetical protein
MLIHLHHVVLQHQVVQQQQLSLVFALMTVLIASLMTSALNQLTGQLTMEIMDHFMVSQRMAMLSMDHTILTGSFGAVMT